MPFTLSHPAAVLLVARTGLPVAAVVAGSMVPDVPMFIPIPGTYAVTHSLLGVVTADVVLGVLGLLVWVHLVRDALVDLAPAPVRERCSVTAGYTRRQWLLAPVGVAVGASTHVVWDSFTHRDRWGAQHVAWLDGMHAGLPGSAWAQYASGVLGVLVCGAWAAGYVMGRERLERAARVPELGVRALALVPVVAAVVTVVALAARLSDGLHAMAFSGAVWGTIAAVATLLVLTLVWHLRARTTSRDPVTVDEHPR